MKTVLILIITFYRKFISPCFPPSCRFSPTCSVYAIEALKKYGFIRGGFLMIKRLLKCHPFSKADYYDPVP